ncbi:MAG: hypothetical protein Q8M79_00535 [Dehalococcoidia bacterium]|nr:hypothetical protein [Dehalococcoidia bacterium]
MASPRRTWATPAQTPDATPAEPAFMMGLEDVRKDPRRAGEQMARHFGLSQPNDEAPPDDPPLV